MQNSIVLFLIGLLCFSHNTYGQPITVVTEHLPPMQIVNNGKLTGGVGTEVVRMMLDKVEGGTKIVPMNWARAYLIAKTQKNVLIFSITRNAERENQFKWDDSIVEHYRQALMAVKAGQRYRKLMEKWQLRSP